MNPAYMNQCDDGVNRSNANSPKMPEINPLQASTAPSDVQADASAESTGLAGPNNGHKSDDKPKNSRPKHQRVGDKEHVGQVLGELQRRMTANCLEVEDVVWGAAVGDKAIARLRVPKTHAPGTVVWVTASYRSTHAKYAAKVTKAEIRLGRDGWRVVSVERGWCPRTPFEEARKGRVRFGDSAQRWIAKHYCPDLRVGEAERSIPTAQGDHLSAPAI